MTRRAVIAGATGEVGRHLTALLAADPAWEVQALVRRPGSLPPAAGLSEVPFDYENEEAYHQLFDTPCDLLLIALGTTRAKAGSDAAFLRVDRDYPIHLIQALGRACPEARVGLVSSVGADRPRGLYLGAKASVESALATSGLAHAIARPSLLRSRRAEIRPLERAMDRLLAPALLALGRACLPRSQGWWRWAPVHVREVAEALLAAVQALAPGQRRVLEGLELHPGPIEQWGEP